MEPCGEDRSDSPFRGKQGLWGHVSSNSGKVWNSLESPGVLRSSTGLESE